MATQAYDVSRRAVFAGAAIAATVPAIIAQAAGASSLQTLHAEWRTTMDQFNAVSLRLSELDDTSPRQSRAHWARLDAAKEEMRVLGKRVKILEARMARHPASTLDELRLKGEVMEELLNDSEDALEVMVRSVISDLRRAA